MATQAQPEKHTQPTSRRVDFPYRAYASLMRLPNVFTAFADICLGGMTTQALDPDAFRWSSFVLLVLASGCLYASGMVWNDFFDIAQDSRERPTRPLPSGLITRRSAMLLGGGLLILGLLCAGLAGWAADEWRMTPLVLASVLVACIFLYDGWLKRTSAGPVAMGACRFLNVLLGLAFVTTAIPWAARIYLAFVVGFYIVGVTGFARTEARLSNRSVLTGALAVMLSALAIGLAAPVVLNARNSSFLFPYLLVALGIWVALPAGQAIREPLPRQVQAAVKSALLGLVLLDAILATGIVGSTGLSIMLLLVPTSYLGRWLYMT